MSALASRARVSFEFSLAGPASPRSRCASPSNCSARERPACAPPRRESARRHLEPEPLRARSAAAQSLFYLAQGVSAFDVVCLPEIGRELGALHRLIGILDPEWGGPISDITEGTPGNDERFAILHDQPRVAFEHIAGEVVRPATMRVGGRQFARKPLPASFRSGEFRFRVGTAPIHYGGGGAEARRHSLAECRILAAFLARVARRDAQNVVVSGNFNIERRDGAAVRAFIAEGFSVPPRIVPPRRHRDVLP